MVRSFGLVSLSGNCPNSVWTDFRPSHIGDFITPLCRKEQRLEQGTKRSGLAKQRPYNAKFIVRKYPSSRTLLRIGPRSNAHKCCIEVELILPLCIPAKGLAQVGSNSVGLNRACLVLDPVQHLRYMRAAKLVNANLTDTWLDQSGKWTLELIRAPKRPFLAPHVSGHEVINNARNGLRRRDRCSVLKRVVAPVNA